MHTFHPVYILDNKHLLWLSCLILRIRQWWSLPYSTDRWNFASGFRSKSLILSTRDKGISQRAFVIDKKYVVGLSKTFLINEFCYNLMEFIPSPKLQHYFPSNLLYMQIHYLCVYMYRLVCKEFKILIFSLLFFFPSLKMHSTSLWFCCYAKPIFSVFCPSVQVLQSEIFSVHLPPITIIGRKLVSFLPYEKGFLSETSGIFYDFSQYRLVGFLCDLSRIRLCYDKEKPGPLPMLRWHHTDRLLTQSIYLHRHIGFPH